MGDTWGIWGTRAWSGREKLEEVDKEIEKSIAGGQVLMGGDWVEKYPELNPEACESFWRN